MASRESIERYRARQAALESKIGEVLENYFNTLDIWDAHSTQAALLDFIPNLVDKYGDVSAQLAVEWYSEQVRESAGAVAAAAFRPKPAARGISRVQMVDAINGKLDALWSDSPQDALPLLVSSAGKWVRQRGRDTVSSNAEREGVRWARVPTGRITCAWCLMLASRDAVYHSQSSAMHSKSGSGKYHGHCDCEAVRIGNEADYPEGYLPENYYQMYNSAVGVVGNRTDTKAIVKALRRLYPDELTDGVHNH